jgi:hypothetical protein
MRTSTRKAWPSLEQGIVEPKAAETAAPAPETIEVTKVVNAEIRNDILFTLHVKWEHILILFLCLVIFFQWCQRVTTN